MSGHFKPWEKSEYDDIQMMNDLKKLDSAMTKALRRTRSDMGTYSVILMSEDNDDLFNDLDNMGLCDLSDQFGTTRQVKKPGDFEYILEIERLNEAEYNGNKFRMVVNPSKWKDFVNMDIKTPDGTITEFGYLIGQYITEEFKASWKQGTKLMTFGKNVLSDTNDIALLFTAASTVASIFNKYYEEFAIDILEPVVTYYLTWFSLLLATAVGGSFIPQSELTMEDTLAYVWTSNDTVEFRALVDTTLSTAVPFLVSKLFANLSSKRTPPSCSKNDRLYMARLAGWYTTADLKLLGSDRTEKNLPTGPTDGWWSKDVSDYFYSPRFVLPLGEKEIEQQRSIRRAIGDLNVLDEYTRTTGFHLLYKIESKDRLLSENTVAVNGNQQANKLKPHEKEFARRLELDPSLQRDLERAVVMARDGPCAHRSKLVKTTLSDAEITATNGSLLCKAFETFMGTRVNGKTPASTAKLVGTLSGDIESHLNIVGNNVVLSDALGSALTNLLAVGGRADSEYKHAKTNKQNQFTTFNRLHPSLDSDRHNYYNHQLSSMVTHFDNDRWINTIKFALLMHNLRPLFKALGANTTAVDNIVNYVSGNNDYKASLTRQAYTLLGRFCVYVPMIAAPKNATFAFEWVPSFTEVGKLLDVFNSASDSTSESGSPNTTTIMTYLKTTQTTEDDENMPTDAQRTYILLDDDFLLGTFAYPSSLLECVVDGVKRV